MRLREPEAFAAAIGAAFATVLAFVMLVASDGRAAAQADKAVVTMKGEEAFKLLVGNTLRSIGTSVEPTPAYRYFRNEHVEYHCRGGKFAARSPKELKVVKWTVGCEIYSVAFKENHLCETYFAETCQHDELTLIFRRKLTSSANDGQILGRVTIPPAGKQKLLASDRLEGEFDLIKGNATIFPDFDPQPRPELLTSLDRPDDIRDEERRCAEGDDLDPQKVMSEISGNTLVTYDRNGKFDGRYAQYFDPNGRVVDVGIPAPTVSVIDPLADHLGGVGINLWKIKDGDLCRTENDAPSEFLCTLSVKVQKPKPGDAQTAPRLCVSGQPVQFIAKGNPFAVDFSRATGK